MTSEYLGLRMLMDTDFVKVKREFSFLHQKFAVSTPQCGVFLTCTGVMKKKFKDANEQEVMVLRQPTFSAVWKMEVHVAHCPPLHIKPRGGLSRSIWINDHNKQHVLKLKPSSSFFKSGEYSILGANEQPVGTIERNWKLSYKMSFPRDLDVRYKCALIAACIFIDEQSVSNND
ncbi:uncharacterized protein LOC126374079 [Pectinophora gossypiella]|uniref:uncharacterized protein LOC126374079 n=1 Tax=Pectinophora gossypiella TaxID=13191 RepID=UPI00214F4394|nr:uncharacterized protein LOC126374079 [Pectinophora gossypiella]